MEKTAGQLYAEREKRVMDAIHLSIPDRVPVQVSPSYFPAKYAGISFEAAYYDYNAWLEAYKKMLHDFQPDVVQTTGFFPGTVWELLEPRTTKWPGHGVPSDHSHQSVEMELMMEDEYDAVLGDATDFMLRTYIPRAFGALESFKMLPPMSTVGRGFNFNAVPILAQALAEPEVAEAIEKLQKAGRELKKWQPQMMAFGDEVEKLGFPLYNRAGAGAAFDLVSDFLRGMRGAMLDMYRYPDKLHEMCERAVPGMISGALTVAKATGNPRIFMALHRGADGFMNIKQFEEFYWPYLKKVIVALIEEDLTPCIFFEGNYDSRIEYLFEIPKGKALAHFDSTDIFRAREILGNHLCFRGNVPASLLQTGTPDEVKDYCKKLIDVVGKDGGLMVSARSSLDEVKPENLHAMIDFTKEYGVYN
ncbi:uroporphyrinogen decarboxylase family protein [Chloroflexota bacterium]